MSLYDHRVCRGCGRMGVTRHTCPSCPCNYCKKDGHIADNCTKLKEKGRQPGSDSSIQPRLPRLQIAGLDAGSGATAAGSASGGPFSASTSNSRRRPDLKHSSVVDTNISLKRKMNPESENARKKSTTTPPILTPSLLSIPSRNFRGVDVSPFLDAEVRCAQRLTNFRSS